MLLSAETLIVEMQALICPALVFLELVEL